MARRRTLNFIEAIGISINATAAVLMLIGVVFLFTGFNSFMLGVLGFGAGLLLAVLATTQLETGFGKSLFQNLSVFLLVGGVFGMAVGIGQFLDVISLQQTSETIRQTGKNLVSIGVIASVISFFLTVIGFSIRKG